MIEKNSSSGSAMRLNRIKKKIEDDEELKEKFKAIIRRMMDVINIDEQIMELQKEIDSYVRRMDVARNPTQAREAISDRSQKIRKLAAKRGAIKAHITMGLKDI